MSTVDANADEIAIEVLIIGAGLGGVGAAMQLRRHGTHDFVVVDSGHRVGGVWRDNQYPNAACDTPIELYAFAERPGSKWSTNYAPWNEILKYLDALVADEGLVEHILLDICIESLHWDVDQAMWHVRAADGRAWAARYVVWAGGLLSQPAIPDVPGLDEFDGLVLHTARWGPDVDLSGRRVLVVGGGATSIQVVPYAAAHADRVYAMVRTPSHVMPKPEKVYDAEDQAAFRADPSIQLGERARWLEHFETLTRTRFPMNDEFIAATEAVWQEYFDSLITDPGLRTLLTPSYRFGCRRPLVSNTYYQAFTLPHVTGIAGTLSRVYPDGVETTAAGRIDVDAIVFATGFDAQGMLGSLHVDNGRGVHLEQQWKDRPQAYLGTLAKDFPNLFLINGPNVGGPVVTDVIAAQSRFIVRCIEHARAASAASDGPGPTVQVEHEAFDTYNADVERRAAGSVLVLGGCTNWYRTSNGTGDVFSHWPGTIASLRDAIDDAPLDDLIITG